MPILAKAALPDRLILLLDGHVLAAPDPTLLAALIPIGGIEVMHLVEPGADRSALHLPALTMALTELYTGLVDRGSVLAMEGSELSNQYNVLMEQDIDFTTRDTLLMSAGYDDLNAGERRLACLESARGFAEYHLQVAKDASLWGGLAPQEWATCLHEAAGSLDIMAEAAGLATALQVSAANRLEQISAQVRAAPLSA